MNIVAAAIKSSVASLYGAHPRMDAKFKLEGFTVSTVLLPLEHPGETWYETCVFAMGDSDIVDRYKTYLEAVAGHNAAVEKVKAYVAGRQKRLEISGRVFIEE